MLVFATMGRGGFRWRKMLEIVEATQMIHAQVVVECYQMLTPV
jgi:hypothetical protein